MSARSFRLATVARRLVCDRGYSLPEMLTVMVILGIVLGGLTAMFHAGVRAEVRANRELDAQQNARAALDRMRRELHCASAITASATTVSATLPGHCPSAVAATTTTVLYSFQNVSTSRYRLRRAVNGGAAVTVADYLTTDNAFAYTAPSSSSLGRLSLDLQVNLKPNEGWKTWRLQTDIVLRNTTRS
jgi:prepilin-type N-terminal cleavage/methylation domain-containing protein